MKRRQITFLMEDHDAATLDALLALKKMDGFVAGLRLALAVEGCDPDVVAWKTTERSVPR